MDSLAPKFLVCPDCLGRKPYDAFPLRGKGVMLRRKCCHECYLQRRRACWKRCDAKRNEQRRTKWQNNEEYRDANKQACARYRERYLEVIAAKNRTRNQYMRHTVLRLYGGQCECCAEKKIEFLVIDHIEGGGNAERKILSPHGVYRKLAKAENLLQGYRVLCHNCNSAYSYYGFCPHREATIADPDDAGMLDVVGFDTSTPTVMSDFVVA